jgi:hypothetical protein
MSWKWKGDELYTEEVDAGFPLRLAGHRITCVWYAPLTGGAYHFYAGTDQGAVVRIPLGD